MGNIRKFKRKRPQPVARPTDGMIYVPGDSPLGRLGTLSAALAEFARPLLEAIESDDPTDAEVQNAMDYAARAWNYAVLVTHFPAGTELGALGVWQEQSGFSADEIRAQFAPFVAAYRANFSGDPRLVRSVEAYVRDGRLTCNASAAMDMKGNWV